ncbi:MAG: family 16 glycosylhydrolase [Oscillospiraceae bacterium]|nr:family 16 glycosylhydrolase [Oscillospiraceae bacterium]MCR5307021.1 family 16 glycosylhydrolase [Oscillospiraceae bacterium]
MKRFLTAALSAAALCLLLTAVCGAETEHSVPGDVNADGSCSPADALLLRDWLTGSGTLTAAQGAAADMNRDGRLNAVDLALLKRQLLSPADAPQLLWCDEFDGDALDRTKWSYELGNWKLDADGNYITNGWGNNEQEFYTDSNASVRDGVLTIAARKEHFSDAVQGEYEYTSARLSTQHLFSVCGGRIEVRARCDAGKSLWPAIWMLPEESLYGGWAASGEIDIMEGWGSTPEKICGTVHFGDVWPNNTYLTADYQFPAGDSAENWHTYAVEWERGVIRWYVDDTLYSTQTDWYSAGHAYPAPFDQKFYLILNLAVGGHFDGVDGIYADPAVFADGEKHFDIDYVRVYDGSFAPSQVTSLPLELYTEGSAAALANRDGETVITVTDAGTLEYAVMGLVRGKTVRAGETHTLTFDAASTAAREIVVTAEDAAYTRYLDERITVPTEKTHFSFSVTAPSDLKLDLKFQLGSIGDAASLPEHTVTLSGITWD